MPAPVLAVNNLHTYFYTAQGVVKSVDGVSFRIHAHETLGVVGESGSGKSVTSLSVMRLIPSPPGRIVGGDILFQGQNLLSMTPRDMRKIRGKDLAMIFQDPMTSLNPVYTVGAQIMEAILLHHKVSKREALTRAIDLLRRVGIPSPEHRVKDYPHQLSGGMRQRVMIAMALSGHPKLLIADEPTTALDVTIQAQILDLMQQLKQEYEAAILLITHDLGVVAEITDRVAVMYAGKIVESATTPDLFRDPLHPYTQGLLASIPRIDGDRSQRLHVIEGTVPNLIHLPQGCAFAPRCPQALAICREKTPEMTEHGAEHRVACWLYGEPQGKEAVS